MDQDMKSIYAELGLEAPAEQPEAAEPAGSTGAKGQAFAGAAAEDQRGINTFDEDENEGFADDGGTGDPSPTGGEVEGGTGRLISGATGSEEDGGERIATAPAGPRNDTDGGTGDPAPAGGEDDGGGKVMSKAQRAEQARLRRERETQAKIAAARQEERERSKAEIAEILKTVGASNRYRDGKKIETLDDYREWERDAAAQRLSQKLQDGNLTAEDLDAAIRATPAMQKLDRLAEQQEAAQRRSAQEKMQELVARELAQIRAQFDPSVHSLKDILDGENGQRFAELVNRNGLSFIDAYRLANAGSIERTRQQAAAEAAARSAAGKSHMVAYGKNNAASVQIPKATLDAYRSLMPDMSEAEIRRHYARTHRD